MNSTMDLSENILVIRCKDEKETARPKTILAGAFLLALLTCHDYFTNVLPSFV